MEHCRSCWLDSCINYIQYIPNRKVCSPKGQKGGRSSKQCSKPSPRVTAIVASCFSTEEFPSAETSSFTPKVQPALLGQKLARYVHANEHTRDTKANSSTRLKQKAAIVHYCWDMSFRANQPWTLPRKGWVSNDHQLPKGLCASRDDPKSLAANLPRDVSFVDASCSLIATASNNLQPSRQS